MSQFFNTIIIEPLYNGFVFLIHILPFADAGIIVVLFTVIIKLILLPLSIKASKAQMKMKSAEKELNGLKEKYKNDKEQLSIKTLEYYREKGINPFSGIFILLIQLPFIIGIYQVFLKSGLPTINTALLYSFIIPPTFAINMMFLGLIDIAQKSIALALLTGLSAYIQVAIAMQSGAGEKGSQNQIAQMMAMQMKYFLPVFMAFIAYTVSGVIALYLITSNVFSIAQEVYIKNKYHKTPPIVV